jgi:hypothetical protein
MNIFFGKNQRPIRRKHTPSKTLGRNSATLHFRLTCSTFSPAVRLISLRETSPNNRFAQLLLSDIAPLPFAIAQSGLHVNFHMAEVRISTETDSLNIEFDEKIKLEKNLYLCKNYIDELE